MRRCLHEWVPGLSTRDLEGRVTAANGSIGSALGDQAESAKGHQAARTMLEAAVAKSQAGWETAIKQMPFSARGDFTQTLDAMADILSQAARGAPESSRELGRLVGVPPGRLVAAIERIGEAREMAQGNVNPQLLLAVLNQDLAVLL